MKNSFRRVVGKGAWVGALAALLPFASAVPAQAAVESDQWQPTGFSAQSTQIMAQTFIAGKTGLLDHVSLKLYGMAHVSLRHVNSDGTPASTDWIASSTPVTYQPCCSYHDFSFSPANVAVAQGATYAIVVTGAAWYFTTAPPGISPTFLGGQLYVSCSGCGKWFSGPGFGADFVFETFVNVSASTPQPPTIAANQPSVSVGEGSTPSMAGTYSDPNGDAVTLSATSGAVTPSSGPASGAWSWTGSAADEGLPQTVTIAVKDSHNLSATALFTVNVTGVKPTAQILNDPETAAEGTLLSFSGAATSPNSADSAAGFTYSWNLTKDGSAIQVGSNSSFSFTVDDESIYVVTLTATDDGGMSSDPVWTTVIGTDTTPAVKVDPVVPTEPALRSPLIIAPQESLDFSGSYTDPATLDTHTAGWTFGDGGAASGLSATHSYAVAGTYVATLTVSDDDGRAGHAQVTVVVETPNQILSGVAAYILGLPSLNAGQKNSLLVKLAAASDAIGRSDTMAAVNELNAAMNELEADNKTGKVSDLVLATLQADISSVQGALDLSPLQG